VGGDEPGKRLENWEEGHGFTFFLLQNQHFLILSPFNFYLYILTHTLLSNQLSLPEIYISSQHAKNEPSEY
jgi:hypothetical protein